MPAETTRGIEPRRVWAFDDAVAGLVPVEDVAETGRLTSSTRDGRMDRARDHPGGLCHRGRASNFGIDVAVPVKARLIFSPFQVCPAPMPARAYARVHRQKTVSVMVERPAAEPLVIPRRELMKDGLFGFSDAAASACVKFAALTPRSRMRS
jgi:hypothetical protein